MALGELEIYVLRLIANRSNSKKRVAFFCPNQGLESNFGDLPNELAIGGCDILWIYGNVSAYYNSIHQNKWLIINDMMKRVEGIDAIVTASVMDCLPDGTLRILHDHLSFAHFDMEENIDLLRQSGASSHVFTSIREIFNKYSAFLVFLPFYDLVLTSSTPVNELTIEALKLNGYAEQGELANPKKGGSFRGSISEYVNIKNYRQRISIRQTGYFKLDAPINKYRDTESEKLVVFAPTPNDISGNKDSPLWVSAKTVNAYAIRLLRALCQAFPDYKIVFKPYKDEIESVVKEINENLSGYDNFVVDYCGGNYWELYSKAKVMISDFSSTAYTFALGIGRPVIFFSPNEEDLPELIRGAAYCQNRDLVGRVAKSVDEVLESMHFIINNYDQYLSNLSNFQLRNLKNPGCSSRIGAEAILDVLFLRDSPSNTLMISS
jgi:hypothetical protein